MLPLHHRGRRSLFGTSSIKKNAYFNFDSQGVDVVKRIFSLNFFDSFIIGIMTIAVPLLMLERGIDIAAIGLVFAIASLAKLVIRTASGLIADSVGDRLFYYLNGISTFAEVAAYWLSTTPVGFAVGKVLHGAKDSFIWAVNRSSLIAAAPSREHFVLGGMISGRQFYFALGSLAVGLLFPLGGFEILFLLAAVLSIIMIFTSAKVKNRRAKSAIKLSDLSLKKKTKRFYETAGAMATGSTFYMVIVYLVAPIFFKSIGFSLQQIGLLYAAYFLIFGLALNIFSHMKINVRPAAVFGSLIFVVSLAGMGLAETGLAAYFFLLMALGDSLLAFLWERIIYLDARQSKNVATEIALLHIPPGIGVFVAMGVSGFVVQQFGFSPIFIAGAISLAIYSAWCLRLEKLKG